jgi:hypothetical protein
MPSLSPTMTQVSRARLALYRRQFAKTSLSLNCSKQTQCLLIVWQPPALLRRLTAHAHVLQAMHPANERK